MKDSDMKKWGRRYDQYKIRGEKANTMKSSNILTLSTSPQTQPAKKPRRFASLALQRRSLCGRTLRYNTGKELDSETGLYYYGARYLDPKTGRWLSGDPALGEYVPQAGKGGDGLPGMGGVYNTVNLHVYHYAGNNPVKYIDPDGKFVMAAAAVPLIIKAAPLITAGLAVLAYGAISYSTSRAAKTVADYNNSITEQNDVINKSQTKDNSRTPLHRAVDQNELDSIVASGGRFSMGDGSTYEFGKLFTIDPQDAVGYALDANEGIARDNPYIAIVSTSAPEGSYTPTYISDAKSAVMVPAENLSLLTPAVVAPLSKE